MRHTLMLNLDEQHAKQLDELSRHFRLAAEDTLRFAIRLAHARYKQKADVLVPELKPRSHRRSGTTATIMNPARKGESR